MTVVFMQLIPQKMAITYALKYFKKVLVQNVSTILCKLMLLESEAGAALGTRK